MRPNKKTIIEIQKLMKKSVAVIEETPKKDNLKNSTIEVSGFKIKYNLYSSETKLSGKTIGVAYSHNCMIKPKANVKSLYFVVNEEINIPKPRLKIHSCKITIGNKNKYIEGLISKPRYK